LRLIVFSDGPLEHGNETPHPGACSPAACGCVSAEETGKQTEVKIQKTRITAEQEVQLGKEAAADVERQLEVLQNQEVESWLNEIGQRLARTPQANSYPYYFKLVNEDSINAFALPGGRCSCIPA